MHPRITQPIRWIALLLAAAMVVAACGDEGAAPDDETTSAVTEPTTAATGPAADGAEVQISDVPQAGSTDVTDAEVGELVVGDTAFAFDLFSEVRTDENLVLSPYSIAAALTMTYAGARTETAEEMRDTLHITLADDRVHTARNEVEIRLDPPQPTPGTEELEAFAIEIANSLWGQTGYRFHDEFLDLLAANYGAGMNLVDFITAAEEARQTINAWVEEATRGRIVDLIPEGVITDLTRLVLVNAIWFKANWLHQFDPANTADGPFTTLTGNEVTVPIMHQSLRGAYADGEGWQAVRLPYAGDGSMLVIVPDDGEMASFAADLDAELLEEIEANLSEHQIELGMPRYEFGADFALEPVLRALGMERAFTEPSLPDGADFTGMTERRELYVHEVVHQAFIAVDEVGTEAAAATAVIVGLESLPPPAELEIDRPFLFVIQHQPTGELLFIGQVADPS